LKLESIKFFEKFSFTLKIYFSHFINSNDDKNFALD
jgi:hypothetical protein